MKLSIKLIGLCSRIALASGFLAAMAVPAHAQTSPETWYIGAGLGQAKIGDLCQGSQRKDCDEQGTAIRLFGGLHLNRYFALEAALNSGSGFLTPGARAYGYDGDTSAGFLGVSAIGFIPLGSRVSLYGGVSGAFSYASVDVTDYQYRGSQSSSCSSSWFDDDDWYSYCNSNSNRYDDETYESDTSVAAGGLLGVDVRVSSRLHLRAQMQRFFNVDGELAFGGRRDVDFITVNVLFAFH